MRNIPAFTRADADERRKSLIAAATRVLARDGAAGASVRAIAQEAGVSPGLVTHHFGGVDALIAATYAHVGAAVTAALDAAKTTPTHRSSAPPFDEREIMRHAPADAAALRPHLGK